jgi:predicted Mrr-cat superfamily restriction endonuclease
MTTAWLVRTGDQGYALHECIENGVIALRYYTVPDATHLTHTQIAKHLEDDPNVSGYSMVAGMLRQYIDEVAIGDIVVTPNAKTGRVWFGAVTGDYEYRDPSPVPDLRHLRGTRWLGDVSRSELAAERLKEIDRPPTLYELGSNERWVETARQVTTEHVALPGRQQRPEKWKRPSTASPTAAELAEDRCTSCFITVPAPSLVDGRCVDCT